jgi:hypothetical protein
LKPTEPAVQISGSDADRRRKIIGVLITDKCTVTFKKWRDKGELESFRVDTRLGSESVQLEVHCRSLSISNHHDARKHQGNENEDRAQAGNVQCQSDLKHDLYFGYVNLS